MKHSSGKSSPPFWAFGLAIVSALLLSACGALPQSSWPGLTVAGDRAYLTNGSQLFAVNPNADNTDRYAITWAFPGEPDRDISEIFAEPAIGDDLIVLTSHQGVVYALNTDGSEQWRQEIVRDRLIAPATIGDEVIYVASSDTTLYALDAENGTVLWTFEDSEQPLWAAPLLAGDVLYLPSLDHHLYALEADTGAVIWRRELAGALADTPVIVDGVLYIGSLSSHAYALDPGNEGKTIWDFETEAGWVWGTPAVDNGRAYFGDLDGNLYAVDADSGEAAWQKKFDSAIRPTPALDDTNLYIVEEDGWLRAIARSNGNERWAVEVEEENDDRLLGPPLIVGDLIVLAPLNANIIRLYAYERDSGAQQWSFEPDS